MINYKNLNRSWWNFKRSWRNLKRSWELQKDLEKNLIKFWRNTEEEDLLNELKPINLWFWSHSFLLLWCKDWSKNWAAYRSMLIASNLVKFSFSFSLSFSFSFSKPVSLVQNGCIHFNLVLVKIGVISSGELLSLASSMTSN